MQAEQRLEASSRRREPPIVAADDRMRRKGGIVDILLYRKERTTAASRTRQLFQKRKTEEMRLNSTNERCSPRIVLNRKRSGDLEHINLDEELQASSINEEKNKLEGLRITITTHHRIYRTNGGESRSTNCFDLFNC